MQSGWLTHTNLFLPLFFNLCNFSLSHKSVGNDTALSWKVAMTNIWCFCLLKVKYVTILGRDNQKLINSINRIWRINICELRWRNEHWNPPSACCASPASCAANWANELTEATVMDVYKENSCYIKLHQLTLLITRTQRQRRASQQRRHSRVAVTELYATYQTPSVIHLMCVCVWQTGGRGCGLPGNTVCVWLIRLSMKCQSWVRTPTETGDTDAKTQPVSQDTSKNITGHLVGSSSSFCRAVHHQ